MNHHRQKNTVWTWEIVHTNQEVLRLRGFGGKSISPFNRISVSQSEPWLIATLPLATYFGSLGPSTKEALRWQLLEESSNNCRRPQTVPPGVLRVYVDDGAAVLTEVAKEVVTLHTQCHDQKTKTKKHKTHSDFLENTSP